MMNGREVWVTGAGMLSPLGNGVDENWESVRTGRHGIARHSLGEGPPLPENFLYFGVVDGYEEPPSVPPKLNSQRKFLNRSSILGLHAVQEAVESSGADIFDIPSARKALYIGSGDFTRIEYLDFYSAFAESSGPDFIPTDFGILNEKALYQVNPFYLLEGLTNNMFSFLSARYEIMGTNGSLTSLSSCGAQALEMCGRAIRTDKADFGLVVSCGSWISELVRFELDGLGILSRASAGVDSFRPLDRRRDGFFPAEGAAVLVLEAADFAQARGASPMGRVQGTGNFQEVVSGSQIAVPFESVVRACRSAVSEAGIENSFLSFILPHGSGTKMGDRLEMRAVKEFLGEDAGKVPLAAWKPYTGHMGSASDIGEIILGLRALADGVLPPTPGFQQAEPEFDVLSVAASERPVGGEAFLSLSHGLGGQASATLLSAP